MLYRPMVHERFAGDDGSHRWPALVCYVWNDAMVNLSVFDANGVHKPHTSVTLAQDRPAEPGECEWMEYQKGQAARTEAAEQKLAEQSPTS